MNNPDDSVQEMREKYDFSQGVHGKYADRFAKGSNVVVLNPDVAAEFTTREAVNEPSASSPGDATAPASASNPRSPFGARAMFGRHVRLD